MTGGEILFFEATKMPGKKGFVLTGQLGEVMKESAQAALSYVRSRAPELDIPPDFFEEIDLHLHIPEGALPKDGPSAGVTMVTAIASLLTGRPVDPDIGMTGEVTLRGKVLRIGGLKEKVLAAARAGLSTIIMPAANEADLEDLPDNVRESMNFTQWTRLTRYWTRRSWICRQCPSRQLPPTRRTRAGNRLRTKKPKTRRNRSSTHRRPDDQLRQVKH